MNHGIYTECKRFAVHDGPGIRTTLFLKGCSLHCSWCHNPETIAPTPQLAFYEGRCLGCGKCVECCSNQQLTAGKRWINREKCTVCGRCVSSCVVGALRIEGKSIGVEEAVAMLLQDRLFYGERGGATLSGGEPLLQADFCAQVLERVKQSGVNTAVDTCGNVPWSALEKVLPHTDLFLYDLKVMDSALHRQYTGCGNQLILENLLRLDGVGAKTEIRMVQIPGVNMDASQIGAAGEFLSQLKHLTSVRLLPYHSLARSKYQAVERLDTMPDVPPPSPEEMEKSAAILKQFSLNICQ